MRSTQRPPKSVAFVLGTRPEIIKLAPLIREMGPAAMLIHSGQHYDAKLSSVFFDQFGLNDPDEFLGIGGNTRGEQIGRAVSALDSRIRKGDIRTVVVQGDTNTVLAGAVAANSNDIPLVHVEAGLRSFDRAMPEEHNRVVADHLADLCCAPTTVNVENLRSERIPQQGIALTGNTIVEALELLRPHDDAVTRAVDAHGLHRDAFVLATFHRPENVDDRGHLQRIIDALAVSSLPVILPLHPRTQKRLDDFSLTPRSDVIRIIDPLDYSTFLALQAASALVVSDSGGVQEEVTVLKRQMVVVRNSTERPESLGVFAQLVQANDDLERTIKEALVDVPERLRSLRDQPCPFGDGQASQRIATLLDAIALLR